MLQTCLKAVFAYCNMLRSLESPPKWLWDESIQVAKAQFKFYAKGQPADIASSMARALHSRSSADILGPPERQLFDPVGIAHVLQSMTPGRMLVTLVSSAINSTELDKVEPVYRTKYAESKIPAAMIAELRESRLNESVLHLPERNQYIPTVLEPLPVEGSHSGAAAAAMDPDEAFVEAPVQVEPESIELSVRSSRMATESNDTAAAALARFASSRRSDHTRSLGSDSSILSPSAMEVWYKQDVVFRRPEQVVYVKLTSSAVATRSSWSVYVSLMLDCIRDALQQEAYLGAKAGYGYSIA